MKLKQLLEKAQDTIKSEKEQSAIDAIAKALIEINELQKAMATAENNLEILLEEDIEDFDVNVW